MGACGDDRRFQTGIIEADADLVGLEGFDAILGDVDGDLHLINGDLHPWSRSLFPAFDGPDVSRVDLGGGNASLLLSYSEKYVSYT